MAHDWKPGDVAMTRYGRAFYSGDDERGSWTFDDGSGGFGPRFKPLQTEAPRDARSLVVIDPEDREQVERLLGAYLDHGFRPAPADAPIRTTGIDYLQQALREFADPKPPKPDEPTGLGAVVVDVEGIRWTRVESGEAQTRNPWYPAAADDFQPDEWANLCAVKVLSEGVTLS